MEKLISKFLKGKPMDMALRQALYEKKKKDDAAASRLAARAISMRTDGNDLISRMEARRKPVVDWGKEKAAKYKENTDRIKAQNQHDRNVRLKLVVKQKVRAPQVVDDSMIKLQSALYNGGFAGDTTYEKFVDGWRKGDNIGKNTQAALDKAIAAGYDEAALRQGKLVKKTNPKPKGNVKSTSGLFDLDGRYIGERRVHILGDGTIINYGAKKHVGDLTKMSDKELKDLYMSGRNSWPAALTTAEGLGRSVVMKYLPAIMPNQVNLTEKDISQSTYNQLAAASEMARRRLRLGTNNVAFGLNYPDYYAFGDGTIYQYQDGQNFDKSDRWYNFIKTLNGGKVKNESTAEFIATAPLRARNSSAAHTFGGASVDIWGGNRIITDDYDFNQKETDRIEEKNQGSGWRFDTGTFGLSDQDNSGKKIKYKINIK